MQLVVIWSLITDHWSHPDYLFPSHQGRAPLPKMLKKDTFFRSEWVNLWSQCQQNHKGNAIWLSPKLHTSRRQGGLLWAGLIMIGLYDHVHPGSGVNSPDWICVTGGRWVELMLGSQLQCQPQYQKLNSPHLLIPLNLGLPSVFSISVNSPIINSTILTEVRVILSFLSVAPTQWFI